MRTQLVDELIFGAFSKAPPQYLHGWSTPEDGFTWALGGEAAIKVPTRTHSSNLIVEITAHPSMRSSTVPGQRLIVKVNGVVVGIQYTSSHAVFAFPYVSEAPAEELTLEFLTPDAPAMNANLADSEDSRCLSFGFERIRLLATSWDPPRPLNTAISQAFADLLGAFESLGGDCEFGLLQRQFGIDPLGLLRFSGQPHRLTVAAIHERFGALQDDSNIKIIRDPVGDEYIVTVPNYGMWYHTFIRLSEVDSAVVKEQQSKVLRFLARKLFEDIERAEKIFVYKPVETVSNAELYALYAALCRFGPVNLLVLDTGSNIPPPHVEVILPGLYKGFIPKFGQPGMPVPEAVDDWLAVCALVARVVCSPPTNP